MEEKDKVCTDNGLEKDVIGRFCKEDGCDMDVTGRLCKENE